MERQYYTPENKKASDRMTKEMLCSLYGVKAEDINCRNCRFFNGHTINLDAKTAYCVYWKTTINWSSFCTHFQIRRKDNDT